MHEKYLGDSYDLVKHFWRESLEPIAPLYAHSRFIPGPIRARYTAVTSIPILESQPPDHYGILLDPHTGIALPGGPLVDATASHAPLSFILKVNEEWHPTYMICFDQSDYRQRGLTREEQRDLKRGFLRERGIGSFYYVSHAPFLFLTSESKILAEIRNHLISIGIPRSRFEPEPRA